MACGLPQVLSSGVGAGRELVREGVNGDIFPAGDSAELARRLVQFAALPDAECARLRAATRAAVDTFDYVHLADTIFDLARSDPSRRP